MTVFKEESSCGSTSVKLWFTSVGFVVSVFVVCEESVLGISVSLPDFSLLLQATTNITAIAEMKRIIFFINYTFKILGLLFLLRVCFFSFIQTATREFAIYFIIC